MPILSDEVLASKYGWSETARQIFRSKYLRRAGVPQSDGSLGGEEHIDQALQRLAGAWAAWGLEGGYFDQPGAEDFQVEILNDLRHRRAFPNSPQWFNTGLYESYGIESGDAGFDLGGDPASARHAQVHACFIQSLEDDLCGPLGIKSLESREGRVFKLGSGTGTCFSTLRGKGEPLKGGGTSSGMISFLAASDAGAGAIKSGGTCLAGYQHVYTETGPVKVEDLAKRPGFIALSYDPPAGRYKAKRAQAWLAGRKRVVRVTTDKGAFDLSYDHPVRLSTGEYVQAGSLTAGLSLFACSVDNRAGYTRVHLRNGQKGKESFHRLVAMDVMGRDVDGLVVHHVDCDPSNNAPDNLQVMTQSEHVLLHREIDQAAGVPHHFEEHTYPRSGRENPMHADAPFWQDPARVQRLRDKQRANMSSERATAQQDSAATAKMINTAFRVINAGYSIDTFEDYVRGREIVVGRIGCKKKLLSSIERRFGSHTGYVKAVSAANHRVVAVETIGEMAVYDVEVDCPTDDDKSPTTGHNFVIWPDATPVGSGVVVANTRRAAKMVVCDLDHLDALDLIRYKARGEDEALAMAIGTHVLRESGQAAYLPEISLGWNAEESAYTYARGQNANFSIRLDGAEFFALCDDDGDFVLRGRASDVTSTIPARQLRDEIAQAAWYSADPGIQFDDLIQAMHTSPSMGRINASNPCVTGDTLVLTSKGWERIDSLLDAPFDAVGADGYAHPVAPAFKTGHKEVLLLTLGSGKTLKLTPDHLVATPRKYDGCAVTGWEDMVVDTPAASLRPGDTVVTFVEGGAPWVWASDVVVGVYPVGKEDVYDLTEPATSHFVANGILVHNCSEYLFADDTACNLASIRLSAFLRADGSLDEQGLADCARRWARVLDISVSGARYPTALIAERTRQSRTIGLGPMDLGGALIRAGLRYDEDDGRRFAARCQAIIHGAAGYESQALAERLGACDAWYENMGPFEQVWDKHTSSYVWLFPSASVPYWPEPYKPFRNAQWTVCAPTGTIGLASGSCTTGIEPLYAAHVTKTLAGGGSIALAAACVEAAPDPRAVVTVADLSWAAHLKMCAALQPFVSGGISKTLNLPAGTTPGDIAGIYRKAWEMGVKCVSVYRDGSKHSQVLGGGDPDDRVRDLVAEMRKPRRIKPPGVQASRRWTARIGQEAAYLTLAGDDLSAPTQLRLEHGSAGSRDASSAEAISKLASLALQYGVPLEAIAETLIDIAGGAAGFVQGGSGEVRSAGSVAAWAGREILAHLGASAPAETHSATPAASDASDACEKCGGTLVQTGTCKMCSKCGHSLGGCG